MNEKTLRLQIMVVHPVIAVAVPSLFVLTLHSMVRGFLGLPSGFPDALIVLGPAASLVEAVAGNAVRKYRAAVHWRIREIALSLLAVLGLFIAVSAPLGHYAYLASMMVISWATSFAIHAALRSREELLRVTEGLSGVAVRRALHQALLLEGDALARVLAVGRLVRVLHGALVIAAVVRVFSGGRLGAAVATLLVLQAVVLQVLTGVLNSFGDEHRLLAQNLRAGAAQRAARLAHGLLLLALSMGTALVLARTRPALDLRRAVDLAGRAVAFLLAHRPRLGPLLLDLLSRFFSWLAGLFSVQSTRLPLGSPFSLPTADNGPSELARRVLFAAGMTVLFLGVGIALAFLMSPLADTEFKEGLRRKRPLSFLVRRLRLLGRLALGLGSRMRAALSALVLDSRDLLRAAARAPGRAGRVRDRPPSRARAGGEEDADGARPRVLRSSRQRARRQFRLLVLWCERNGIPHPPCSGPLDLVKEAGRRFPSRAASLLQSAELLERVLYSRHGTSRAELRALGRAVQAATRGR